MLQDEPERLGDVVASLQAMWGLKHIYCWHGLAAYWSGVATGQHFFLTQNCRQLRSVLLPAEAKWLWVSPLHWSDAL